LWGPIFELEEYACAHTRMHTCASACAHIHTRGHAHTHAYASVCKQTHAHTTTHAFTIIIHQIHILIN